MSDRPSDIPMKFSRPDADVFVPSGGKPEAAFGRVTHLCIAAHADDIEIMAADAILACRGSQELAFGGVVVADGAGSPRTGPFASLDNAGMVAVRREEQRSAASLGKYAVQVQLGHPSAAVKAGDHAVATDLDSILAAARPRVVYLHNPADKHDTHAAVMARCIEALRRLPSNHRPGRVLGCEVWRGLDWLDDAEKVALDSSGDPKLAADLIAVFRSQIEGGKRYDLGTLGRRAANATFHQPRVGDAATSVTWAMDLTPLARDQNLSIAEFTLAQVDRLKADIAARLGRVGGI